MLTLFINIDCTFLSKYITDLKMSNNNMGHVWVCSILDIIWLMSQICSQTANIHETKPLGSHLNLSEEESGFPYLLVKDHAKAGKYFTCRVCILMKKRHIQG